MNWKRSIKHIKLKKTAIQVRNSVTWGTQQNFIGENANLRKQSSSLLKEKIMSPRFQVRAVSFHHENGSAISEYLRRFQKDKKEGGNYFSLPSLPPLINPSTED